MGSAASLVACGRDGSESTGRAPAAVQLAEPELQLWDEETVLIASAPSGPPLAYVSMRHRRVFVDRGARDRAHLMLGAHISVSTGHWRIHLPGDDLRQPITPGDASREFEEYRMAEWDPGLQAAEGDIRILRGGRAPVSVDLSCVRVRGPGEGWCSGGPWDWVRCDEEGAELCREDLMLVGRGTRHSEGECSGTGAPVRFLTWAIRA